MPFIFGADRSRDDLSRLVGAMSQVAGVRLFELTDGRARGLRVADVHTGSGLRFQVLLDRALDIGAAEYAGRPLAWVHPALGGPHLYEPQGYGWLRTFGGGLVTTCGLTHFGQPEQDGKEHLGLHGRISHAPAERVRITEEWRGDEYVLEIEGQVTQAVLFGENLLLSRKISTRLGGTSLSIEDRVYNRGYRVTPHMILYHCNFGFPVVAPESELLLVDASVRPRDEAAEAWLDHHRSFDPPDPMYAEQVFFHEPVVSPDGCVRVAIVNRQMELGAYIRYRAAELPCLAQWKMMGAGEYVCALEPTNVWETPRHRLREEGRLKQLAPGEEIAYFLELGVLTDAEDIRRFEHEMPS